MMYPYMTVNSIGGLAVWRSGGMPLRSEKGGTVVVHFELPNKDIGFKEVDILLSTYTVCSNLGFTKNELSIPRELYRDNAHLMIQHEKQEEIKIV